IQFAVTGTINLTRALPNLTRSVSIEVPRLNLLTVRRNTGGNYRIFAVSSGATAILSGLTITNGAVSEPERGGGIFNQGTLTLNNAAVSGNYAGGNDRSTF